jgi:DNA-binding response OmpR family regulator
LHDQNFEVIQAGSGKEGLIYAWRDHPDLIIIDPMMVDLKGEEIAAKLRQDARTAHVPLIALSSDQNHCCGSRPALMQGLMNILLNQGRLFPH